MESPGHTVSVGKIIKQWMYDKTLNWNVLSIYIPQFVTTVILEQQQIWMASPQLFSEYHHWQNMM